MALQIPASIPFHAKLGILNHDYFSLPPEARFSDPPFLSIPTALSSSPFLVSWVISMHALACTPLFPA